MSDFDAVPGLMAELEQLQKEVQGRVDVLATTHQMMVDPYTMLTMRVESLVEALIPQQLPDALGVLAPNPDRGMFEVLHARRMVEALDHLIREAGKAKLTVPGAAPFDLGRRP